MRNYLKVIHDPGKRGPRFKDLHFDDAIPADVHEKLLYAVRLARRRNGTISIYRRPAAAVIDRAMAEFAPHVSASLQALSVLPEIGEPCPFAALAEWHNTGDLQRHDFTRGRLVGAALQPWPRQPEACA